MSKIIQLTKVSKSFPPFSGCALKPISFSVHEGETLSVMGRSGAGKSTLLKILGLIETPSEGEYWLNGDLVNNLSIKQMASYRNELLGFVFQDFHLLNHRSVVDNVALPLWYRGYSKKSAKILALNQLQALNMLPFQNHKPKSLSGGEKQRVAIARALVGKPKIILADEPTGALDKKTSLEVMDLLISTCESEGVSLVVVTHDESVAHRCNRQILIS